MEKEKEFTVSFTRMVTLTRDLVDAYGRWVHFNNKLEFEPENRYYSDLRGQECGRATALAYSLSLIAAGEDADVLDHLRDMVFGEVRNDDLTTIAYRLFEKLDIVID